MKKTRKMTYLAMGIALYVVISIMLKIPVINRIKLDLGYLVFAYYLCEFGVIATVVGVLGCIFTNLLIGASFPIAWAIGQLFVGISLGCLLKKTDKLYLRIIMSAIATFIGIGLIKTVLEILLFKLPPLAKFMSNLAAVAVDCLSFIIGLWLYKKRNIFKH
ncbi:MAG: ECF transporter S component [Erysipelotrichaceae bacterium]|nr:ECF transporter S component [Erysipelotrichaceae bacterium]